MRGFDKRAKNQLIKILQGYLVLLVPDPVLKECRGESGAVAMV